MLMEVTDHMDRSQETISVMHAESMITMTAFASGEELQCLAPREET